jgi:hypothetical protein
VLHGHPKIRSRHYILSLYVDVRSTAARNPLHFAKFRRTGRNCGSLAMSCKPDPVSGPETSGGENFAVGEKDAVIIVDHGSRRQESNLMLSNGPVVIRMYFLLPLWCFYVDLIHLEICRRLCCDVQGADWLQDRRACPYGSIHYSFFLMHFFP